MDANVLISYLLNPIGVGPPSTLVRTAISGKVTPLVSPKFIREVGRKVATKPYLTTRIPADNIDRLVRALTITGELNDDADILYPTITRDPKDDYLIANAVVYRADYLVSGDPDLLVLGEFEGILIVSPVRFVRILEIGDDAGETPLK